MRYDDPELRDRLAADYVVGIMPGRARRRFERLAEADGALQALVDAWSERLSPLDAALPAEAPPPRVWRKIESTLDREQSAIMPVGLRNEETPGLLDAAIETMARSLRLWRATALGFGAAAAALLVFVATLDRAPPAPGRVLAILSDPAGEPGWIATAIPGADRVTVVAVRAVPPDPAHSLELWSIAGGTPRPLGLVTTDPDQPTLVKAADLPRAAGALAISNEPPGGSPTGLPTGPVLFQGKLLQTL